MVAGAGGGPDFEKRAGEMKLGRANFRRRVLISRAFGCGFGVPCGVAGGTPDFQNAIGQIKLGRVDSAGRGRIRRGFGSRFAGLRRAEGP